MRIVVSGTHASGKSTLIADFRLRHPEFALLPDPFELLDEAGDAPSGALFGAQLRISADRLRDETTGDVIAERGPVDFLAYLLALDDLGGHGLGREALAHAISLTRSAMSRVDLLVVLPLSARDAIPVGEEEHLELRQSMKERLLDLVDDPDVVGDGMVVAEVSGPPDVRLARLLEAVASEGG